MDSYIVKTTLQLLLSAFLAAIVGFDRERKSRPAGLRTHILVGLGSTLFTLASIEAAVGPFEADSGRIAAQIVSGIGFLGAGTIIHHGTSVRGLTTAATLWAVAAIGMCVGYGGRMLGVATIGTIITLATLTAVRRVEGLLEASRQVDEIIVSLDKGVNVMQQVIAILHEYDIEVIQSDFMQDQGPGGEIHIQISSTDKNTAARISRRLSHVHGVRNVALN